MKIFGMDLWRIILCVVLIVIVIKRANIVAFFAKPKYAKGNYEGALKILRVANKIGNLNLKNKEMYGYVLLRCGYDDEAYREFRELLLLTKPNSPSRYQVKLLIALALWKKGELKEATEEMEEIVEAGYKTTQIYQNLGILYNLGDDKDKALKFNLEAYEYNKDDNVICDNLADIYAIRGEYEKSADIYEEFIDRNPAFPEAYYGYGRVLFALGQKEDGIQLIEESLTKTFSYLSVKSKEEVEKMLEEYKSQV